MASHKAIANRIHSVIPFRNSQTLEGPSGTGGVAEPLVCAQSIPVVIPFCVPLLIRSIYPQSSSLLLLVNLLFVLLLVRGFALHVSEGGGGGSLCTYFHEKGGFALHVENSAESQKPVEIGGLRAQGASGEWERLEIQNAPPGP